jgi:hypothetical protein
VIAVVCGLAKRYALLTRYATYAAATLAPPSALRSLMPLTSVPNSQILPLSLFVVKMVLVS